jgi:antitoxin (DNA-binding transcriptional repressor) of toxin-antitoxin stability system
MMHTIVAVEDMKETLTELLDRLKPGEVIILTRNNQPVARLSAEPAPNPRLRLPPGLGKGMITIVSNDEDHLKDFAEYMP